MIWLPRTTDNSTYFAQSLEIRGSESRLYLFAASLEVYINTLLIHVNIYESKEAGIVCFIIRKLLLKTYSKTCLKGPLKNRQNKGLKDK